MPYLRVFSLKVQAKESERKHVQTPYQMSLLLQIDSILRIII